jgi:hypothetical protein
MSPLTLAIVIVLVLVIGYVLWKAFFSPSPPGPPPVTKHLVLFGAGNDGNIYTLMPPKMTWSLLGSAGGVNIISFNAADGMLYGLDSNLALRGTKPGPHMTWALVPNQLSGDSLAGITFDHTGALWGVSINGILYTKGTNLAGPWTTVATLTTDVRAIAFDNSGALWGISTQGVNNLVYRQAPHDFAGPWVAVPHAGTSTVPFNIHIDPVTGYFYGAGTPSSWSLVSSPNLATTPWSIVSVTNPTLVQDVAVAYM